MPNPVWSSAQKAYVHDMMIVRVPLETGGGQLLFAKRKFDKNLEIKFFRKVENPNSGNRHFTGFYETIDLTNYVYHKIDFVNGNIVNQLTTKSINTDDVLPLETITLGGGNGWLSAFWYCFKRYIFAIPKWVNGGWECYGLGGSGSGSENEVELPEGEDGDGGGLNQNIQILFPPILPFPQPPSPWNPYDLNPISIGGGPFYNQNDQENYSLTLNRNPFNDDTGDEEYKFLEGKFDNLSYDSYNLVQFPTINPIIPIRDFVGWNTNLYPSNWDCMDYAKKQIEFLGYTLSKYNAPGQTIQIYTEKDGTNFNLVKEGIGYLITALKNNIPVIVGVDIKNGSSNPLTDNSTDHFIVIVGSGHENGKDYFLFYDNASGIPQYGASNLNRLYYNPINGRISGTSSTPYASRAGHHEYILTQIRKSKKI